LLLLNPLPEEDWFELEEWEEELEEFEFA